MSHFSQHRRGRSPSRRDFVKAASLAIGAPWIVPSSVFAAAAPSNRINVAAIGNGNQSTLDLPAFLQQDDVQVVAVCDLNMASCGYRTPGQFLGRFAPSTAAAATCRTSSRPLLATLPKPAVMR